MCCWPVPAMRNSLVCGSRKKRSMASSSISLWMPLPSLSSSARVLGSMAKVMAGSGSLTVGYWMGAALSPRVSPVSGVLQLGHGADVAGVQLVDRDRCLALHDGKVGELLRRVLRVKFCTEASFFSTPENTLK